MWPFKVVDQHSRPYISIDVGGTQRSFSPEEISAMVLTKMKVSTLAGISSQTLEAVTWARGLCLLLASRPVLLEVCWVTYSCCLPSWSDHC